MSVSTRFHRRWFKLSSRGLQVVGLLGVLLGAIGAGVGPTTAVGIILIGLGTSLLASVLVGSIALGRDELLQQLLGDGVQDVFENRKTNFEDSFWDDLLASTDKHFRVLGTANHGYVQDPAVEATTKEGVVDAIVKRDVEVEFLWLRPDSDLAKARQREERRTTCRDTVNSILSFWEVRQELPPEKREKLLLKEYVATPSCGVTWSDDLLVVTQYLAGNPNLHAPGMVLGRSYSWLDRPIELLRNKRPKFPPITQRYMGNFDAIRLGATTITKERVGELREMLPELEKEAEQLGLRSEADIRKDESGPAPASPDGEEE
jgi:hypothetical protein